MRTYLRVAAVFIFLGFFAAIFPISSYAQAGATSGTITGTVTDPTGAVVKGATVTIENPVSQFRRSEKTDGVGSFTFVNVPFNPYHLAVSGSGFSSSAQDVDVRSAVPVTVPVKLAIGSAATTIQVTAADLLENDTTMHTDVDRNLFETIPLESQSSSLSSLVTLASPGVAADSNGLFHGLGDHAENSFSVDGQPITDQQSKVFSNQLPSSAVQSMEVIDGAPPAEYGDKTSLVIQVTTRSGQGLTKPTGSIYATYGSFGSTTEGFDLGYGKKNWGNFISVDGLNSSRFLDPPEFAVFHDKGNEENVFDRVDYQPNTANSFHLNLNYSRSWFQTPNAYDNLNPGNVNLAGTPVAGQADQRSKIGTFNVAPGYTRVINQYSVFNFGVYLRKDNYHYYGSKDPFADLGPIQQESIGQDRSLANYGVHSDISWVKGRQNVKLGAMYEQTLLRENDALGIVDPGYLDSLTDADGNPCMSGGTPDVALAAPCTDLYPYDLTRGGSFYNFLGRTDVKELALYIEDQIKAGNWLFNLGMRGDLYNGLAAESQAEPRLGISYSIKPTNTVLRISYARTLETPFNENLVLASRGCLNAVVNPLLGCQGGDTGALTPGFRNEFHAGLQQAVGKHFVVSGDYIWKYTHNGYDFSVLGNTPITFPVEWHNSKIPGIALRADVTQIHNFSAYVVMSSVAARFFPPQVGGAGATVGESGYPFRIDHDEKFNETTHFQYQLPWKHMPWYSFNWRYDSGLVAGAVPCYNVTDPNSLCNPDNDGTSITLPDGRPGIDLSGLTADQQFEAGLTCDGVAATPGSGFTSCDAAGLTSKLVQIPAPGKENDDHDPPRVQPRSLFDMALGEDNLFHGDKYKWGAQISAINVTNKYALYNFLSTFSGTHYVTPRAITGQITLSF
ncbi:MAG TPA: TonB-dependent receptor [Acidobacteriaceae bacterium]|nr:TonB-dependent receptor [Acidobacteriaceae bacterium]